MFTLPGLSFNDPPLPSSSSPSPDALRKADAMLATDRDASAAVAVAMAAAAAGVSNAPAAPTFASSAHVQQAECTDRDKHFSCIGTDILGASCSKRIVRNFKKHGRGVVCTSCDTNIVRCENKVECKHIVHKGCYEQMSDGTRMQPTDPWICSRCLTAKTPKTSEQHLTAPPSSTCDTADPKPKPKCSKIPFSSEAALKAAIAENGLACRSSRINKDGCVTSYYYCPTCNGQPSSRFRDPNWILSLPEEHAQCKKPAIGVVDYQKGLSPEMLAKIRELSAPGNLSGLQIQEQIKFSLTVTVSVDLIYRIGSALRRKLYGSSGDHGHLLRLQEERRVSLPQYA